ncbi:hypothetical protein QBC43DRAFT_114400 [Cladorrhinum sp. PSN259]|nr:hypothetical protein QBC43DRAFT_114400 [Cladorrhinum sp. PSN259]
MDENAPSLDVFIAVNMIQGASQDMTVGDLNGRRLSFKNDNRPGERYLYFLFVIAQLKMAWRQEYLTDHAKKLTPQLGKGFWATQNQYLNRALLLALAEKIGNATLFPENMSPRPGTGDEDEYNGETGLAAIAEIIAAQRREDE